MTTRQPTHDIHFRKRVRRGQNITTTPQPAVHHIPFQMRDPSSNEVCCCCCSLATQRVRSAHLSDDIIGEIRRPEHLSGLQDRHLARLLGIAAHEQISKVARLRLRDGHLFHDLAAASSLPGHSSRVSRTNSPPDLAEDGESTAHFLVNPRKGGANGTGKSSSWTRLGFRRNVSSARVEVSRGWMFLSLFEALKAEEVARRSDWILAIEFRLKHGHLVPRKICEF